MRKSAALVGLLVLLMSWSCAFSPSVGPGGTPNDTSGQEEQRQDNGASADLDTAAWKDQAAEAADDMVGDSATDAGADAPGEDSSVDSVTPDGAGLDGLDGADLIEDGQKFDTCTPACDYPACGNEDGCGGTCGCPSGYDCPGTAPFFCAPDCADLCIGRRCGKAGLADECDCSSLNGGCDDKNPCTKNVCDAAGQCTNPADNDGGACSDGQGTCKAGSCVVSGFVSIAAGTFWMGSPDGICPSGYPGSCGVEPGRGINEALYQVILKRSFDIQVTEATQGEWKASFGNWNPSYFSGCGDTCPVEQVSWFDALAFANRKSTAGGLTPCYVFSAVKCVDGKDAGALWDQCMNATQKGIESATVTLTGGVLKPYECTGYRLPTESEWEYAARAGTTTAFSNGGITQTGCVPKDPNLDLIGWYCANSEGAAHPAGGKAENPWGMKDQAGNVGEWTWDNYEASYPSGSASDPVGPAASVFRVLRGGSWNVNAVYCRSAAREFNKPGYRSKSLGFRLARSRGELGPACSSDDGFCCVAGEVKNNGMPCSDDGNKCNGVSTCWNGTCTQILPPVVCTPVDGCHSAGVCDPDTGQCTVPTGNEGKPCNDDGDKCNGMSTCVGGLCKQTTAPVACTPLDLCHVAGVCAPSTGICTNPAGNEGAVCNNGKGNCVAGQCAIAGFMPVAAGTFWMGSPDGACPAGYPGSCAPELGRKADEILHQVTLTRSFEIQVNEVTQGEWKATFGGWNPSYFPGCGDKCPVENVSWLDALAYANRKSTAAGLAACYLLSNVQCENAAPVGTAYEQCMNSGKGGIDSGVVALAGGVASPYDCTGYRLPTEAEWEYAARAGSTTAFYPAGSSNGSITQTGSNPVDPNLALIGWYDGNSNASYSGAYTCTGSVDGTSKCGTQPGAGKLANAWGLRDMSGNVYEWNWDRYEAYKPGNVTNPTGGATGWDMVRRGGSWFTNSETCRSASRTSAESGSRYSSLGFRLVRTLSAGVQCGGVSCPVLVGYNVSCNPQSHCEYTNVDGSGWRKWDTWIWIPPGTVKLGSPSTEAGRDEDEDDTVGAGGAVYPVTFAKGYFIGKYEVVVRQYEACIGDSACTKADTSDWSGDGWGVNTVANGRETHPQNGLTWQQARDFCAWVAPGGRLPSEAEWEYAAKGPIHWKYPWGTTPEPTCTNNTAVFDEDGSASRPWGCSSCTTAGCSGTSPVGSKVAGAAWSGALDMAGNVWEWCQDWYHNSYKDAPKNGSAWEDPSGASRVMRGGGFYHKAAYLRSAERTNYPPTGDNAYLGARCVR